MGAVVYEFEGLDNALPYLPMSARRFLDFTGRRLSLAGWRSLGPDARWAIARAGAGERVLVEAASVLDAAVPEATHVPPVADPSAASPPEKLVEALGPERPLDKGRWQGLSALDRYVLAKSAAKPEKLARAYDAILGLASPAQTVAGERGAPGVSRTEAPSRRAVASAFVQTTRAVVEAVTTGRAAKGDVLGAARVAGILAAKRAPELIPLCHPVQTTHAAIDFEPDAGRGRIGVLATVEALEPTGVDVEALVAVTVAALTVYDMVKSADRWATIEAIGLESAVDGKGQAVAPPSARGA